VIGRASLPASRRFEVNGRRLSRSFALPCDMTLGPVIGRASLPASRRFEVNGRRLSRSFALPCDMTLER
jgi:hypothetical protein